MMYVQRSLLAAVLVTLAAVPASAQMIGNPVYYSPKHGAGFSLHGDYARGLNEASGETNYFGARAVLGLPVVTLSAGGGIVRNGESEVTFGGTASLNVLSAPFMPIAIAVQAGAGYMSTAGGSLLNVPIGLAIAVKPPTPGINVEAWAAPRVQIQRVSNGTSDTDTRFGASVGVNLGLPTGIGLHAAIDFVDQATESDPILVGIGLHYKFSIPGLGVVGM